MKQKCECPRNDLARFAQQIIVLCAQGSSDQHCTLHTVFSCSLALACSATQRNFVAGQTPGLPGSLRNPRAAAALSSRQQLRFLRGVAARQQAHKQQL